MEYVIIGVVLLVILLAVLKANKKDASMDLNKFNKKYEDKAIGIGNIEDLNDENDFISGAFSYTPAEDNNENDYIIYLFDGSCDDSGYCNHGDFLFAAFNEKTKEVIYKLEDW